MSDPDRVDAARPSPKLRLVVVEGDDPHAPAGMELLARWRDWIELDRFADLDALSSTRTGRSDCSDEPPEADDAFARVDGFVLPDAENAAPGILERLKHAPGIPRIDWRRLVDGSERDHFFEQALGRRRIRLLFHPAWTQAELVAFNTRERHRVIAHDPKRHRLIGRLVAKAKDHARADLEREIGELYAGALARPVTRRKHANVLENVMEILERGASAESRLAMAGAVESYASGEERLWPVIQLLREEARHQGLIGLAAQSYLDPEPIERALRFESP